jgi:hypothetical protein
VSFVGGDCLVEDDRMLDAGRCTLDFGFQVKQSGFYCII